MSKKYEIVSRPDTVNSIKGIVSQDEYLLEGLEYSIQYFLYECWWV